MKKKCSKEKWSTKLQYDFVQAYTSCINNQSGCYLLLNNFYVQLLLNPYSLVFICADALRPSQPFSLMLGRYTI